MMGEQSKNPNPNCSAGTTERKTKEKNNQYEFCKVCKLNHNQGRRHNYFPNHGKSLTSFLSRFQSKLSDVRFFLKNPSLLRPELASVNRFWCVFCDCDVMELDSSFACENAINHLASADHLKNLKAFMWKFGGGMDRVDRFRVSEQELAKYEKKCIPMKSEGASEKPRGPLIGPSNDIHNELKYEYVDNFDKSNIKSHNSGLPLQNYTNENYQVSRSEPSGIAELGASSFNDRSMSASLLLDSNIPCSNGLTGYAGCQKSSGRSCLSEGYFHKEVGKMHQIYAEKGEANGEGNSAGLLKLTQVRSKAHEEIVGNVHSGAPPPWIDATNGIQFDPAVKPGKGLDNVIKNGKSKLNPKRVGAAWAERRKAEMGMEKRGELPTKRSEFDANWLPNFGGVWQSGSRKESKKKFESEAKKPLKDENQSEISVQLQPYISKRMRREASE